MEAVKERLRVDVLLFHHKEFLPRVLKRVILAGIELNESLI
jgi:hypothetical protein